MHIRKGTRYTVDAEWKAMEEVIETSYRRGGKSASLTSPLSKVTMMNMLKNLEIPERNYVVFKKKRVDYLYIDAYEEFIGKLYNTSINSITLKNISDGDTYFRNNFESICLRFSGYENVIGCSAEGYISHILASRMSSRQWDGQ